jgi:hypothetical protein
MVRVWPYSASDSFDYQVQVKNEVGCLFEVEPNNDFPIATPYVLGTVMNGIIDQSTVDPNSADVDLYSFDVDEEVMLSLWSDGYDGFEVDTGFDLYVGPDDFGFYYYTGVSNDDCVDWFSCLDVILPPADDLLGNTVADADYLLNVSTWWLNKNFPYELHSAVLAVPNMEVEPNDTCATANEADLGDTIMGAIDPTCDFDQFDITLAENTYVIFETDGAMDSTMALETMGGDWLACDDDSGYSLGSRIEGCLPPGDYCLHLRNYSAYSTGLYELTIRAAAAACRPILRT